MKKRSPESQAKKVLSDLIKRAEALRPQNEGQVNIANQIDDLVYGQAWDEMKNDLTAFARKVADIEDLFVEFENEA